MSKDGWIFSGAILRGDRERQEDAFCFWPEEHVTRTSDPDSGVETVVSEYSSPQLLLVVADGMGGHVGGAAASQAAVQAFRDAFSTGEGEVRTRLYTAVLAANEAISTLIVGRPELSGMGCTLTAAALQGMLLEHISVGDSPLFVLTERGIERANIDHSMRSTIAQAVRDGEITPADAERHPYRNALTSALTGFSIAEIDQPPAARQLNPSDIIVLGTDGLLTLSYRDIEYLLRARTEDRPAALLGYLREGLAQKAPAHQDNTTILLALYKERSGSRF